MWYQQVYRRGVVTLPESGEPETEWMLVPRWHEGTRIGDWLEMALLKRKTCNDGSACRLEVSIDDAVPMPFEEANVFFLQMSLTSLAVKRAR